jgi:putative endonuclease
MGHVPKDPVRAKGSGADVQGRQRRRAAVDRVVEPSLAKQARGKWGEDLAARWYAARGYEVVDRNWRSPTGEIDLVVCSESTVVFCEIKTRASDRYGPPQSAVGHVKQRRLRLLAVQWLAAHDRHGAIRFDVAAITGVHIEVFEAAF